MQGSQGVKEGKPRTGRHESAGASTPKPGSPPADLIRAASSPAAQIPPAASESLLFVSRLSLALEDVAKTFFFTSYAPASPTPYLADLSDILAADGFSTSAILAPALASLSLELSQPSLMEVARKHYALAIQQTNRALASIDLAVRDATLASVFLLALFEALTFHGRSSPTSWTQHMNGAAELLKLRGRKQFDSLLGRNMFLDVASEIFTSCAQRRLAVPPALSELLAQVADVVGSDDPEVGFARAAAGMAELANMLFAGRINPQQSIVIVQRACQLDAQIEQLLEQLAGFCMYTVVPPAKAPASAYNNLAHDYDNPKSCRNWNILRMMRLFVNKWIFHIASGAGDAMPDRMELVQRAAGNSERMAADILSTVPYLYTLPPSSYARLMTGRWLIWPLSVVATSVVAPMTARIFARNALHALGRDTGITQATEAANMVDESQALEDW
ncbi:35d86a0f-1a21-447a-9554-22470fe581ac [Thermothielavioides terrestris]|uniref:35d86a0f-1a21-447a-9554-22470fe581ac n=1 Tax=Thermothielavioides terrestris TaxID=2587410 RepID=A0A446BVI8_9PEZI|nr:35d86a0f-1a21-447a-9554-22470fe581ac [Thermothielavioides terrestris]